jgi:cytochrome c oxidase assembly factor CtaG
MFWWPIIRPWPSRPLQSRWVLIPYLLLADMLNTGVSAFLCFAGRLLYPSYDAIPRPFGLSALNDQAAAGAFMWVCGSIVFLLPVLVVITQVLSPSATSRQTYARTNLLIERSTISHQANREAV